VFFVTPTSICAEFAAQFRKDCQPPINFEIEIHGVSPGQSAGEADKIGRARKTRFTEKCEGSEIFAVTGR
jgi:hypothetical protein